MTLPLTPSQTVGPFLHLGFTPLNRDHLASPAMAGEAIAVQGLVLDGNGTGLGDAVIEIWQADPQGRYGGAEGSRPGDGFTGFGRIPTGETGAFRFTTIKPGPVPRPDGSFQAPHLVVTVFARGLVRQLTTRLYFPGETSNEGDQVLSLVPEERRGTLIARPVSRGLLEWNVVLQGPGETVFFDV